MIAGPAIKRVGFVMILLFTLCQLAGIVMLNYIYMSCVKINEKIEGNHKNAIQEIVL